jgi:uncharacterized protein (TIGR03083 family)
VAVGKTYAEARLRIADLVVGLGEEADRPVPTCPAWSVRDVIAHLAGVCADILAGNLVGVGTEPWTDAQVSARRGQSIDDLIKEWWQLAPQVEQFGDHFPGRTGAQWVLDVTTHEHDIRGALGAPGARQSEGVGMGLDLLVTALLHAAVSARGLPPVEVRAGGRSWTVGTGEPAVAGNEETLAAAAAKRARTALISGDCPPAGEPTGAVEVPAFELLRALTGRRSQEQIRRFGWTLDPQPYLVAFQNGPFTTSLHDVEE